MTYKCNVLFVAGNRAPVVRATTPWLLLFLRCAAPRMRGSVHACAPDTLAARAHAYPRDASFLAFCFSRCGGRARVAAHFYRRVALPSFSFSSSSSFLSFPSLMPRWFRRIKSVSRRFYLKPPHSSFPDGIALVFLLVPPV